METLIHADIFFFITSVAVGILSAVLIIIAVYVVRIMNDIKHISTIARDQADALKQDIEDLREQLKQNERWGLLSPLISLVQRFGKTGKGRKQTNGSK